MKVHNGQGEEFGECAIVAEDSQHAAMRAMRRDSATAIAALVADPQPHAREINFADDALPDPPSIAPACNAHHFADKFMAQCPAKIVISTQNFNVGVADSREANAH